MTSTGSTQAAGPQRDSSSLPSGTVAVAVSSDGAYLETYSNGFSLSDEELDEAVSLATASGSAELKESQQESILKKMADLKLQHDYEEAVSLLERIPPEVLAAYADRSSRTSSMNWNRGGDAFAER